MNEINYTVVTLNQKEETLTPEKIKELYSKRLLHEDSLVFSPETGKWQTLAKTFDLKTFPPRDLFRASVQIQSNSAPVHSAQTTRIEHNPYQTVQQPFTQNSNFQNSSYQGNYQQYQSSYQNQHYQNAHFQSPPQSSNSGVKIVGIILGVILLAVVGIGTIAYFGFSNFAKMGSDRAFLKEINKLEIPGKEFVDSETGARINIPKTWRLIKAPNQLIDAPDAKMMATDRNANRSVMLEIVELPSTRNGEKLIYPSNLLDEMSVKIEQMLRAESKKYQTLRTESTLAGKLFGKKIIYERIPQVSTEKQNTMFEFDKEVKGQIAFFKDENTIYILQTWCLKEDFQQAIPEFMEIEKNFSVGQTK